MAGDRTINAPYVSLAYTDATPGNPIPITALNPLPVSGTSSISGTVSIAGTGIAGTPAGGVLTIQGVAGGTPAPMNLTQLAGNAVLTGAFSNTASVVGMLDVIPVAIANAAAPTITEGRFSQLSTDLNSNLRNTLGTLIEGENQVSHRLNNEPIYSYARMTTAATLLVKSGAGTLHSITINTSVASGTIEFDDALTNTTPIIGKITLPATGFPTGPVTALYDVSFATGLSITTTGTMDITIAYR